MDELNDGSKKSHKKPHSGRKAEKKDKKKNQHIQELTDAQRNPKAFTFNSAVRAERNFRRGQDIQTKKHHVPKVDRTPIEPPPILVVVVGPPKVGKSLLIHCLIKSFTKQPLTTLKGPVTVVTGKKRRITFMECNNDINSMIDLAKIADLVLLLIDASFGFEMEIFEFLNICQVHGMPKIMGVLTHLDMLKNTKALKKTKKTLKHRFWTEVYAGAKLFYLSGILHNEYLRNEVKNLGRFISVMKFRPLIWQMTHPYLLADRMEDLTSPEVLRQNDKADRTVSVYGYMRGIPLIKNSSVHIPGCGDFLLKDVSFLPDPCPLPEQLKKRALGEKERLIYAPFSGVGGIVYDKDAVYIELAGSHSHTKTSSGEQPVRDMVSNILESKNTLDSKIAQSEVQLFSNAAPILASEFQSESTNSNLPEGISLKHVDDNGRQRRKVVFNDDNDDDDGDNMEVDGDDDDEEDDEGIEKDNSDSDLSDVEVKKVDSADDDDSSEDDLMEDKTGLNWKSNLAQKAANAFLERQADSASLWKLVYGETKFQGIRGVRGKEEEGNKEEDLEEGLFKMVKQNEDKKLLEKDMMDLEDVTKKINKEQSRDWSQEAVRNTIKDCFVTGKWKSTEDARKLLHGDKIDDDDDDICDGDFEDLETGEKHEGKPEESTAEPEDEDKSKEKLAEKKKKLKEKFDVEYDDGKDGGDKTWYDELRREATEQAELNRKQFEDMDDALRVQLEGFRAGQRLIIELDKVPCELVTNFDASYPLIVGSLQPGEENVGFVKARVKKHRWFERILKTNDPLIISLGWRRFQTIAVYSKLEDNLRHRMLKYTPQHVACMAHFWGPITRTGTGLLAVQDVAARQSGFRIVATGTVLDTNQTTEITKKLKLTGVPYKIYKKTAFIKDMFNSNLEVARFEGARIKTVSNIRGQIKKAESKPEGAFRATFEDKIQLSDIVFCRTWYKVEVPKMYNPVTSLLLPAESKNSWRGMKTVGQLKREQGVHSQPQSDSLYSEIQRDPVVFKPLSIPRRLQKELPYRMKPKHRHNMRKNAPKLDRVAVVRDVEESKVASLMAKLKSNYKAKVRQQKREMSARVKQHRQTNHLEEMQRQRKRAEKIKSQHRKQAKKQNH
ncbi:hypothetical protein LSTR_LSTR005094 [Laodelphax striatellus]|uniref:Bms1-type G domain-containing protein n=1 Tax=Laodelphax striatellus TaxID=195883 RepID=A0A482WQL0_LAOST|nr:hypothetical protein LSTR_LSTR005094 [Laodelphax striatellus]